MGKMTINGTTGVVQIDVPLNQEEADNLVQNFGSHRQAIRSKARSLGEAIDAAADEAELDTIDIESGWPAQS